MRILYTNQSGILENPLTGSERGKRGVATVECFLKLACGKGMRLPRFPRRNMLNARPPPRNPCSTLRVVRGDAGNFLRLPFALAVTSFPNPFPTTPLLMLSRGKRSVRGATKFTIENAILCTQVDSLFCGGEGRSGGGQPYSPLGNFMFGGQRISNRPPAWAQVRQNRAAPATSTLGGTQALAAQTLRTKIVLRG